MNLEGFPLLFIDLQKEGRSWKFLPDYMALSWGWGLWGYGTNVSAFSTWFNMDFPLIWYLLPNTHIEWVVAPCVKFSHLLAGFHWGYWSICNCLFVFSVGGERSWSFLFFHLSDSQVISIQDFSMVDSSIWKNSATDLSSKEYWKKWRWLTLHFVDCLIESYLFDLIVEGTFFF